MDLSAAQTAPAARPAYRRAGLLAKAAVTMLCLYLVARRIDAAELVGSLSEARGSYLVAGAAMYLIGQAMTAYRWQLLARAAGFACTVGEAVRYFFIGMFFNHLGPSTIGGDVVRGLYLADLPARVATAVTTVFFDRLMGLWTLLLMTVAAMAVVGTFEVPWPLVAAAVAGTMALPAAWALARPLARSLFAADGRIRRVVETEMSAYWTDRRMLAATFAVSMSFHGWQIVAAIVVGRAVGLEVEPGYYFIFHPLVAVFAGLPLSVAGYGIRELGYVYFLADLAGAGSETAVAFAVAWLAILLIASAAGGLVFWLTGAGLPTLGRKP